MGTHCHHYTTGAKLSQNSFSYKSIFYIQVFRIKSFLLLVSARSPPWHRLSASNPFPVTAQVMTKAVKLFCANFSVGNFQFQSLFSCFQISRMGAESSSLLSGVIIDSSPILTTQDWSLHHAQVSAPIKYQLNRSLLSFEWILCNFLLCRGRRVTRASFPCSSTMSSAKVEGSSFSPKTSHSIVTPEYCDTSPGFPDLPKRISSQRKPPLCRW